jgi:hypothetical protein
MAAAALNMISHSPSSAGDLARPTDAARTTAPRAYSPNAALIDAGINTEDAPARDQRNMSIAERSDRVRARLWTKDLNILPVDLNEILYSISLNEALWCEYSATKLVKPSTVATTTGYS